MYFYLHLLFLPHFKHILYIIIYFITKIIIINFYKKKYTNHFYYNCFKCVYEVTISFNEIKISI